jgi:hypothetical protein
MKDYLKATAAGVTQVVPIDEYVSAPILADDGWVALSADTTLTAAHSGKKFALAATGKAITLPAVAAGLDYEFICAADIASSGWVITATTKVISGSAEVAGAVVPAVLEDVITLVHAKAVIGDWVRIKSDGTRWYASGCGVTAGSITFTGAL